MDAERRLNKILELASSFSPDDLTSAVNKLSKFKKSKKGAEGSGSARERTLPARPLPQPLKEERISSSPAWKVSFLF
jgi:hypothetical protein